MAGRGGVKLKEYRSSITSVKQWLSEIAFPHLSIVEVFSSSFGHCQVILPTINSIMTNTPDADKKVRWLTVNIGKLEEEQKQAEEDEQKKDEEMTGSTTSRRQTPAIIMSPPTQTSQVHVIKTIQEQKEQPPQQQSEADDDDTDADNTQPSAASQPALDPSIPTIPLLEAYHAYDHPRPLWLFFLAGKLQYELTSANPPKLQRLVASCLSGDKLSQDELAGMELQTDSAEVAAEKRRKRLQKKKEEEEAKRKAKELEEAQQAKKKKEIIRTTPEYLIHISLSAFTNITSDADTAPAVTTRQPVLVLYWKEGDSEFYFHSQTLRAPVSASATVICPNAVVWKKPETAEAASNIELKLALYESDDDEPIRGDRDGVRLLGEGYTKLASLITGDGSVRIMHQDLTIPPLSPTAKTPRAVQNADRVMAVAQLVVKDRVSEGVLSNYRFNVSVNGLAAATAPADSAAVSANAYTVSLYAIDDTAPVPVLVCSTESSSVLPLAFTTPLTATHYSNLPRQLLYQLCTHTGAVINSAQIPLQSLVVKAGGVATVAAVDAAGEQSGVEFVLRIDEVDDEGNVIAPAPAAVSEEEKLRLAALRWLQVDFSVVNLPPALITQQGVLALYQQEVSGAITLLGTAALSPSDTSASASSPPALCSGRTFLVALDTVLLPTYKVVILSSSSSPSISSDSTVIAQHLFDLSALDGKSTADLTLETAEGAAMDGVILRSAAVDMGQQVQMQLRFTATELPVLPRGADHTQCNAVVAAWSVEKDSKDLLGRTELVSDASSAAFSRVIPCTAYTNSSASLTVRVYDVSSDDDSLPSDADCIVQHSGLSLSSLLYGDEVGLPVMAVDGSTLPDVRLTVRNEKPLPRVELDASKAEETNTQAPPEVQLPVEQQPLEPNATTEKAEAATKAPVTSLVLSFEAAGIEGGEGPATLTLFAVDSSGEQKEAVGSTEAAVQAGSAAFASPITVDSSSDTDRSIRVSLQVAGEMRGEVTLPITSLASIERGASSSFTLTSAGQPLPTTLTIRVNPQTDEMVTAKAASSASSRPGSVPANTAASPQSRVTTPLPPSTPSGSKPPLSTRSSKPSAAPTPRAPGSAAGGSRVGSGGSAQPTPRAAKKEDEKSVGSKKTTPKATPRPVTSNLSSSRRERERSISNKVEVTTAAAEQQQHSRTSSGSISKKRVSIHDDAAPQQSVPGPDTVQDTPAVVAVPDVVAVPAPDAFAPAVPDVVAVTVPEVAIVAAPEAVTVAVPEVAAVAAPDVVAVAVPEVVPVAVPEVVAVQAEVAAAVDAEMEQAQQQQAPDAEEEYTDDTEPTAPVVAETDVTAAAQAETEVKQNELPEATEQSEQQQPETTETKEEQPVPSQTEVQQAADVKAETDDTDYADDTEAEAAAE